MSLDVTIIYKKPKMVEYNATHAACGRTVENRKKLLPFNPANGWGSYDGFVPWLIKYKEACEDNPGCNHYIINTIRPSALTNISGKRQITA